MNELQQIKETRAKLLADAKELLGRAKTDARDLTAEENAKVDAIYAEFDKLGERAATMERMNRLERAQADLDRYERRTDPVRPGLVQPKPKMGEAVRSWLLRGKARLSAEQLENAERCGIDLYANEITVPIGGPNAEAAQRAGEMTTGGASSGTGLVQWREFYDGFNRALKYYGTAINNVSRISTDTGVLLPVPTFDDTNNTGRWLGEGVTVTGTNPTVGNITLGAWKASSDEVPVSIELLQDSQTVLDALLPSLLGERIGRLVNAAIVGGTGTSQPYGILTRATASGVVIGGTNAAPTYSLDNFIDLKYSVDRAYRNAPADKRGFMFHDTILSKIRKLKDNQNRYYADPFQAGPGTLDGDPIFINNAVPNTGVSATVAAYGDYSQYLFREVMQVMFMRLDQIRIRDGYVVFLAFYRCDGNLLNQSAVKTLANPAA